MINISILVILSQFTVTVTSLTALSTTTTRCFVGGPIALMIAPDYERRKSGLTGLQDLYVNPDHPGNPVASR
jgi:hypothetical protein